MVERGKSAAGSSTRTDVPLAELALSNVGLAATALDAESPEGKRRSGEGRSEPRGETSLERSPEPDPWVGRLLANVYRVDAKIGEGGMGAVYRATHVHLGKQVAVKVLTDSIAQKRDAVERLRQEAIAASSIDHDNIVDVVSFDRYDDGSVFIVMELLRGESLAERIEKLRAGGHALPLVDTLQIALQICDALGAAHERGIVHRDLKPENVFLAKKGERERVKVLDFGISKIKSAEAEQVRMTRTGQLVGTPLYMSPEQARGETDIDRRVDVYSLGVMLYEMLTGSPPFDGRNYFELLWKHGNEAPPSIRDKSPTLVCPPELDLAIQRALAKDRGVRFQTMGELAEALRAVAPDLSLPGASIPPGMRSSTPSGESRALGVTPAPGARAEARVSASPAANEPHARGPQGLLWVGAAGLFALVLGSGVYAAVSGGGPIATTAPPHGAGPLPSPSIMPPPTTTTPPTTTMPDTTAQGTTAQGTTAQGTTASSAVTVSFGSEPMGAEVFAGESRLCTTPCLWDLPGGTEATLRFHRDGYLDALEQIVPSEGLSVSPRLRARRREAVAGERGSGPAIKTSL
jgi:eukaryotic-like serine/threonine-protein kinase